MITKLTCLAIRAFSWTPSISCEITAAHSTEGKSMQKRMKSLMLLCVGTRKSIQGRMMRNECAKR